ncbi:MAG: hypothetical protein RBT16_06690 [Desulfococcus multivorans]|jgi:hypothetical protein|nr:hypothetical protein [Desulfococcus multivorans]
MITFNLIWLGLKFKWYKNHIPGASTRNVHGEGRGYLEDTVKTGCCCGIQAHFADVDTFRDAGAAYVTPLKP